MKRLIKLNETNEDEMNFDEVKEEVLTCLQNMRLKVNNWEVRDILKSFTEYGFYNGPEMSNIDPNEAIKICDKIIEFVEDSTEEDEDTLFEIDEKIYNFAH